MLVSAIYIFLYIRISQCQHYWSPQLKQRKRLQNTTSACGVTCVGVLSYYKHLHPDTITLEMASGHTGEGLSPRLTYHLCTSDASPQVQVITWASGDKALWKGAPDAAGFPCTQKALEEEPVGCQGYWRAKSGSDGSLWIENRALSLLIFLSLKVIREAKTQRASGGSGECVCVNRERQKHAAL